MGGEEPDLLGPDPVPGRDRTWSRGEHRAALTSQPIPVILFPAALKDAFRYPFRS